MTIVFSKHSIRCNLIHHVWDTVCLLAHCRNLLTPKFNTKPCSGLTTRPLDDSAIYRVFDLALRNNHTHKYWAPLAHAQSQRLHVFILLSLRIQMEQLCQKFALTSCQYHVRIFCSVPLPKQRVPIEAA